MNMDINLEYNAPCLLAILDKEGRILKSTDRIGTCLPAANEGLNQFLHQLHLDRDPSAVVEAFEREQNLTFFGRTIEGSIWRFSFCFEADSAASTLLADDVTDCYEEILRNRILVDLIDKTPDYVGLARGDHSGLWVNESMRKALNVGTDEELARVTIESAHSRGIGAYSTTEVLDWAKRAGHVFAETTLHDQHTGEGIEVSLVLSAHHDPLHDQYFFSALERDISDVRATERELRRARAQLQRSLTDTTLTLQEREEQIDYSRDVWRSLVESSEDLVLFTDHQGKVLFNNQGFLPDDNSNLREQSAFDLFRAEHAESLVTQYRELIDGQRDHINCESDCISSHGVRKHCVILINRLERDSGNHAATWIISDATESHEFQQQLMAQEQMAATGRMAARVAHEINNPLAAIRSSLELIRMDHNEGRSIDATLSLMNSELDRVSNIIRQMYGLYQPERNAVQAIEITSIINDCLTLLQSGARQKNITLDCNCRHRLYAQASEAGLRQILFNILQNALDASPRGKAVVVGIHEEGKRVIVNVDDEGAGLPEHEAQQLFEPFFTTKDSYGGSGLGLGLSVSASLVKGMGGSLELQNRSEGGSRAVIILKAAPENSV
jgi:PAS domain S-box-containing protein